VPEPRVQNFVESLRQRQQEQSAGNGAVRVPGNGKPTPPRESIFHPEMLTKLGRLELISHTVVDGFLSGKHRSTHKGGCTDFAEFRPYSKGDDIRQLDWRQFAKSDRYYVKQFDDETNLQALLIVDSSGSMQFGLSTVTKWRYAQMTAACLGHLLLRQRDSVGLAVVGAGLRDFVKPLPRASHLARVIDLLEKTDAGGKASLDVALLDVSGRLKRRGLVVLVSDCFGDVAKLSRALQQFRARGNDVVVFQVLAPEELTFPFRREAFFQDLEHSRRLQVNPNTVRKNYLIQFQAFIDELHLSLRDLGVDLVTLTTDADLGETLAYYLRRRAAMNKVGSVRARA
jgi:uncharacterized protein (DUF58 family)